MGIYIDRDFVDISDTKESSTLALFFVPQVGAGVLSCNGMANAAIVVVSGCCYKSSHFNQCCIFLEVYGSTASPLNSFSRISTCKMELRFLEKVVKLRSLCLLCSGI